MIPIQIVSVDQILHRSVFTVRFLNDLAARRGILYAIGRGILYAIGM